MEKLYLEQQGNILLFISFDPPHTVEQQSVDQLYVEQQDAWQLYVEQQGGG